MKLRELLPLRYKYLFHMRWSHTVIYLAELGILMFLLIKEEWVFFALFMALIIAEDYAHNKKITKIEEASRIY